MQIDSQIIYSLAEERLAAGERVKLAFGGTSMLPTLHGSDTIVLESLADEPRVGDVLLFHHEGRRVVHRLVKIKNDIYILQGDNNIGTEQVHRNDLLARLVAVTHADGREVTTDNPKWHRSSRCRLSISKAKRLAVRWLGHTGRRQLRPWYFGLLAFLMWAPLNGVGIPLDNYILGLRADHLLHASVFIPCTLFLMDLKRVHHSSLITHHLLVWLLAIAIGLTTEWGQYLLPFRKFDINDLIANSLGVTLGWMVILLARRRLRHR
ncbi:MAG: VanZ family protein [Bacteroidales bacterium]|nr:VanZ family protein [Bacteroidales bacterium]